MTCPNCHLNQAQEHPLFGCLPCVLCQAHLRDLPQPEHQVEFTSDSIKAQRKEFKDDIEQWHRKGELNKRALDIYGVEKARAHGFSDSEIKNATYVYAGDDSYYKE